MKLIYKHINTTFSISTKDISDLSFKTKVDKALLNEFRGFIPEKNELSGGLFFYFTDNISSFINNDDYYKSDYVNVGEDNIHYNDSEINMLVLLNEPFKFIIELNNHESLGSSLRVFHRGFKNKLERDISIFYYRIFLLFTQIWNIENGYTYIHSACVSQNNIGTIFSADSGVGKSSLLFKLSQNSNFSFIGDDLSIINKDACASFLGRLISLKPYHLSYFPFLKDIVSSKMPVLQKLQWRFLKRSKLLFRINPHDLFDNYIDNIKIKSFIHMSNHTKSSFEIKTISSDELLNISLAIFNNEFLLSFNRLNNIASLPGSSFLSSSQIMYNVKNIYSQAFTNIDRKLVLAPYHSNPNELYDFLIQKGCLN
ncbi:MAG: hypothetical protein VX370_01875 [Bacteroidota bacterium]|nr:hypothetical protein [Bacteroidota bacterium]